MTKQANPAERSTLPSTYHLHPDEWVVSKTGAGAYHGQRPRIGTTTTELVLTSRNILVVSVTMMGRPKGVRYFPLDQIRVIDGRPQVFAAGGIGRNLLEVHFHHGQESFGFGSRNELHAWVDNVYKLMTGRSDEISTTTDLSTNGGGSVGDQLKDQLKDTLDQFKASLGLASGDDHKGIATSNPDRAAGKCTSCSAPITGITGRVVRCEYCQSHQQL